MRDQSYTGGRVRVFRANLGFAPLRTVAPKLGLACLCFRAISCRRLSHLHLRIRRLCSYPFFVLPIFLRIPYTTFVGSQLTGTCAPGPKHSLRAFFHSFHPTGSHHNNPRLADCLWARANYHDTHAPQLGRTSPFSRFVLDGPFTTQM